MNPSSPLIPLLAYGCLLASSVAYLTFTATGGK